MTPDAGTSFVDWLPGVAAVFGFVGVIATLVVNGLRTERQRRRELHVRALEAALAYLEMPYAIMRRRCEPEHRSAERVRLSERFAEVQIDLAACQALIRADGRDSVSQAYDRLVDVLRSVAGGEASKAWDAEPIERDDQVGMGDLHAVLEPVRTEKDRFARAAAESTGSKRRA